jgi:glycosyltransferase involved in cell wall biosynthesis
LSYNGLLEPILSSQAIPYLKGLAKEGYEFILVTYEKKRDIEKTEKARIAHIREELKSHGIEWIYLRYHKNPRLISTLFDIFTGIIYCLYLIPAKKIKIVHVRGITPGSIMIVLSKFFKVKVLFDMRGRLAEEMAAGGLWSEGSLQYKLVKFAEARLLRSADAVTVLTKRHLEYNKKLPYLKDKGTVMEIIPCCVDINKFNFDIKEAADFKKTLGLENKFILMYLGKIGTFYFMERMLDFFGELLKTVPDAIFVILTPYEAPELYEKALSRGIDKDNIRVVVGLKFEDMPKYLQIADAGIFFINSYNKMGSSPIKMGEFLACGVPVITNPGVGDTEDIVKRERIGILVAHFQGNHYKEAVRDILDLKKTGDELRDRCRDAARRCLSLEDGISKYKKIYEELS